MAQNISCYLEDENGKVVLNSGLNFANINKILWKVDKSKEKYQWLHTIDEYGYTTFNHLQVPLIISELTQLKNDVDQELKNLITQFIEFISKTDRHQFIKFIGD